MTILALRGISRDRLRERDCELDRERGLDLDRKERDLLPPRSREGLRERDRRVPLSLSGDLEYERARGGGEVACVSSASVAAGGAWAGVLERPRDSLRAGGEDIMMSGSSKELMQYAYCIFWFTGPNI